VSEAITEPSDANVCNVVEKLVCDSGLAETVVLVITAEESGPVVVVEAIVVSTLVVMEISDVDEAVVTGKAVEDKPVLVVSVGGPVNIEEVTLLSV
jgi:hypothetical protein